ncbi:hypothetical protein C0J52_18206 [Blattella germanica]|nr:hypothetical protein C0J52_18206 [Blattella germanica]
MKRIDTFMHEIRKHSCVRLEHTATSLAQLQGGLPNQLLADACIVEKTLFYSWKTSCLMNLEKKKYCIYLYEFLQLWDDSDDLEVVRRALDIPVSSWPMWHPARRHLRNWSSDTRKRYLPYHPVVRFRSPKPDFGDYPILGYARRYEDPLKKDLSAAEVLAILSTIMVDRASQGRLKGLRFGISKR